MTQLEKELIQIPAGSIELRDDRTKQQWSVEIKAFMLATFPVTQELFLQITGEDPSTIKGSQHPVETITWKDAITFCNHLSQLAFLPSCYYLHPDNETISFDNNANGYRLPIEAEWEYACRAGTKSIRYGELDQIAWYNENAGGTTHPVGQLLPNAWGLHDMLGNVWEWCSDIYDESVYGTYRIFRGGGWADEARSVMATTRRRSHPLQFKIDDLGFRLARNKF